MAFGRVPEHASTRRANPHDIDYCLCQDGQVLRQKFEAETNITGYLVMDLSQSMAYTYRQELTKFDYAIRLAAALCI
jgi:hypothetical protein